MYKLTIVQKRKSEYSDYMNEQQVEFVGNSSYELLMIADKLMACKVHSETTYKLEKIQEKEGESNETGI